MPGGRSDPRRRRSGGRCGTFRLRGRKTSVTGDGCRVPRDYPRRQGDRPWRAGASLSPSPAEVPVSTAAIPAPSRRDVTLDILRVIGIAAVVVAHVWWMTDWAHAYVFSWNMPLFFFLTGYLWKTRPFGSMVRRRSEMLLVPYAFWLVVWSVIVVVVTGQYTVRFLVGQVIGGRYMADKPFWAFWFSTALFVLVVAYWAVSKLPLWAQWIVAVVLLIPAYVVPDLVRMVPFAAATGLACMVFLLAGRTVRRFEGRVPALVRIIVGAVAVVGSFIVFGTGLAQPVDLKVVEF